MVVLKLEEVHDFSELDLLRVDASQLRKNFIASLLQLQTEHRVQVFAN